jgi:hypothetical protein
MAEILSNDGSAETNRGDLMKSVILDNYQNVALKIAGWSTLAGCDPRQACRVNRPLPALAR